MVCLGGVWPEFRVSLWWVGRLVRVWAFCGQRQRPHPRRLCPTVRVESQLRPGRFGRTVKKVTTESPCNDQASGLTSAFSQILDKGL